MTSTPLIRFRILDSSFHYTSSFATDIRKTFERARAEQAQDASKSCVNVRHLELPRKIA
jgi:hypothetical protein